MPRTYQSSFVSGELTPEAHARIDLARWQSSVRTAVNFLILRQGGACNRPGLQYVASVKDHAEAVKLLPFVYSETQSYVLEFGDLYLRVYAGSTMVQELVTPYPLADVPSLRITQSGDVVTILHEAYTTQELRRTGASTFALSEYESDDGPFLDLNTDESVQVHASATTGNVTLTATDDIFNADHVGALFYLEQKDLAELAPWEPSKRLAGPGGNCLGLKRRSSSKNYRCVTDYTVPGGGIQVQTGNVTPIHDKGVAADGDGNEISSTANRAGVEWLYEDSGYGILRITAYNSPTSVDATVLRQLPAAVVGGATTAAGPWNMTGDGSDTTLSVTGATSNDSQDYEVLVNGNPLAPTEFTVNATTDVLTFVVAPAISAAVVARQLATDRRSDVWAFGAWSEDQGYPRVSTYFGDRQAFANTAGRPKTTWTTRVGEFTSFGKSVPLVDSDALTFTLNSRRLQTIVDLLPLDQLVMLTSGGVWRVLTGEESVLTPETAGAKQSSSFGAADVSAVLIGQGAIYVGKDHHLRDLRYNPDSNGYSGDDLSVIANHLFDGYTVSNLDYSEAPLGITWALRSDGVVLALTYVREQEQVAFTRGIVTDGVVESFCVVPESGEDVLYCAVRRTIGGATRRFIEKLHTRRFSTIADAFFVDSGLSFDGRHTGSTTMTVSGGIAWDGSETLTLTASASTFAADDVGDEIRLYDGDELVRLTITAYSSVTVVSVEPVGPVPESLRAVATTDWAFARDSFSGLTHLANSGVVALVDGSVVSDLTVSAAGVVTLEAPGVVVHIGLPYDADLETLDLNLGPNGRDMAKNVHGVTLLVKDSRGVRAGPDEDHLDLYADRESENYSDPTAPITDAVELNIDSNWNRHGRVLIRQSDPLPITVLGILPRFEVGA